MGKKYFVYMMANRFNSVIYIGVTNDLIRRVYEHRNNLVPGFTQKYKCHKLVWFQDTDDIRVAIETEKRMKKWKRKYKENLIEAINPGWRDLYEDLI